MRQSGPGWWSRHWYGDDPDNRWVLPVAVGLVALQLAYRAWASYGSWWEGDDFVYIARAFTPGGTSPSALLASYAGHLLPADFYATWLVNRVSPYGWTLAAVTLTGLQLLVNLGFLRLMLVAFGRRWGIIPPLVLFLATSFTVQDSVWWATGIQSLPFKASLCWALASQVRYAQRRNPVSALAACAWVVFGLLFLEKSVLVIGAMAIVTVAYFTQGGTRERLRQLWSGFRLSVVANAVLGAGYLVLYVRYGLNFSPDQATNVPIGPTADVMVLRSFGTGVLGGPLSWTHSPGDPVSYARPSSILVLLSWAALVLVVREVARSRTHSMRALCLPAYFLVCDVLLIVAGRAGTYGPLIGYEIRYLTELSVATAAALAFATMPVRGGSQPVETKRPSVLLDRRAPAAWACVVVGGLATVSTFAYISNWHHNQPATAIIQNLVSDARRVPAGTPVVDTEVPKTVLLPIAYPDNTVGRLLRPLGLPLTYATAGDTSLLYLRPDGHLGPIAVTPVRTGLPAGGPCPNAVGRGSRTIRLDGPLLYGGWWVRVGYVATADSAITVSAGGLTQQASVTSGLHALYFMAGPHRFDSIRIGGLIGDARLCTDDVTVGRATVVGSQGASTQ